MKIKSLNREYIIIAGVWMLIYVFAPLYVWYADMVNGFDFNVGRLCDMWETTTIFLLLYVLHHFILVPKLFITKRYATYIAALCLCMAVLTLRQYYHKPEHFGHRSDMHMPHKEPHAHHKMLGPPDVACLVMALLMIGVDIGTVAWINSQKLRRQLLLLEKQHLKQELEHLRYQINPHFLMNTLNSIHVLVDLDQERAKRAIIELSGLMRHSLYNGQESMTPLQNEIEFLRQYISLMQLRFGNRVALSADLPDSPSRDIMMPPLVLATFVENAFKHGISCQSPSYINIVLNVNSDRKTIHFMCENTRNANAAAQDGYHGIGLNNVRKCLDLQYGDNYTLNISTDTQEQFIVDLTLPIQNGII